MVWWCWQTAKAKAEKSALFLWFPVLCWIVKVISMIYFGISCVSGAERVYFVLLRAKERKYMYFILYHMVKSSFSRWETIPWFDLKNISDPEDRLLLLVQPKVLLAFSCHDGTFQNHQNSSSTRTTRDFSVELLSILFAPGPSFCMELFLFGDEKKMQKTHLEFIIYYIFRPRCSF